MRAQSSNPTGVFSNKSKRQQNNREHHSCSPHSRARRHRRASPLHPPLPRTRREVLEHVRHGHAADVAPAVVAHRAHHLAAHPAALGRRRRHLRGCDRPQAGSECGGRGVRLVQRRHLRGTTAGAAVNTALALGSAFEVGPRPAAEGDLLWTCCATLEFFLSRRSSEAWVSLLPARPRTLTPLPCGSAHSRPWHPPASRTSRTHP